MCGLLLFLILFKFGAKRHSFVSKPLKLHLLLFTKW
jgi:hypothetical protein